LNDVLDARRIQTRTPRRKRDQPWDIRAKKLVKGALFTGAHSGH